MDAAPRPAGRGSPERDPRGFPGRYGIPGAIIVSLVANLALIMERVEFRRHGVANHPFLGAVRRSALENALALLTGDEGLATDPLPPVAVRN